MTDSNPQGGRPPTSAAYWQASRLSPQRFPPLPPAAKWARIAGFIGIGYASLGIVIAAIAMLVAIVAASTASGGNSRYGRSATADAAGFVAVSLVVGVLVMALMLPMLICAYRLARRPTKAMAFAVTAFSGLPALYGALLAVVNVFRGVPSLVLLGLLLIAGGALPLLLMWRPPESRSYLLGATGTAFWGLQGRAPGGPGTSVPDGHFGNPPSNQPTLGATPPPAPRGSYPAQPPHPSSPGWPGAPQQPPSRQQPPQTGQPPQA